MFAHKDPGLRDPNLFIYGLAGTWGLEALWRWGMTFVPVMWTIWGALAVCLAALCIYRMSLTRDEEDQIVLDDTFDKVKNENAAIVAKVKKLEPWVRVFLGLLGIMTVVVIVYYIHDIMSKLGLIGR